MEPLLGSAPAPALVFPAPFAFLALDIETANGRPDEAERHMRLTWSPSSKWKALTIGERYLDAEETWKGKLALLDTAPIVVVSLQTESELRCLHALGAAPPHEVHGGVVEGFGSMREMLIALRTGLDARVGPETPLVGHNIVEFDLPKLRHAYVRSGLRLPVCLRDRDQPVYDCMVEFVRRFCVGRSRIMVSLSDLLDELRLPNHKREMDGSQVPRLVEEGRVDELVAYALRDAAIEAELYRRMSGMGEDVPEAKP